MEYNENPSISSSLDSTCSQKMVTVTKFLDNGNGKYFKALYTFTKIRPADHQSCKEKSCLIQETFHFHLQHVLLKVQIDVPINSADPPL